MYDRWMDPQTGQKQGKWRFLLFDAIVISGKRLHDRPYSKRLAYIDQEIIRPRQALAVGGGAIISPKMGCTI